MRETARILIAQGAKAAEVGKAVGAERKSVLSAARRYNLGSFMPGRAVDIPADLAANWQTMTIRDMSKHYQRNRDTISRWGIVLGLPSKVSRANPKPRKPKPKPTSLGRMGSPPAAIDRPYIEDSPAGESARFLQRDTIAYRKGDGWVVGRLFLSDAEVIERANAKRARMGL